MHPYTEGLPEPAPQPGLRAKIAAASPQRDPPVTGPGSGEVGGALQR